MGFKFEGLEEFKSAFQRIRDRGPETIDASVRSYVEEDLFPRTQEMVPKKSGELAATGSVEHGGKQGSWKVVYGNSSVEDDSAVDYAAAVHEETRNRHAPPTGAKYVEVPLREGVGRLAERVAKDLEDLARG